MQEIEDNGLVANAYSVGEYARERMDDLAARYEVIGDVRGSG